MKKGKKYNHIVVDKDGHASVNWDDPETQKIWREKLRDLNPDMPQYKTFTDNTCPENLCPKQFIQLSLDNNLPETKLVEDVQWEELFKLRKKDNIDIKYREVVDPEGIRMCSTYGLYVWTKYVATQNCTIGGQRALQFSSKPVYDKPSLIAPYTWSNDSASGRIDAPEGYVFPGPEEYSLMKPWRE